MKSSIPCRMTVSLLGLLIILGACDLGLPGTGRVETPTALVSVSLPAISPLILSAFERAGAAASKSADSRALMFVTKAYIEVRNPDGSTVSGKSATIFPTNSGPGSGSSYAFSLLVGSTYKIHVDIYNYRISSTTPVLVGESGITVNNWDNWVSITPVPSSATPITGGSAGYDIEASSLSMVDTGPNGPNFTYTGGEGWYSFTAPSEVAAITMTPDAAGFYDYFMIADSNGVSSSAALSPSFMDLSGGPGGSSSSAVLVTGLTTGKTFYMGIFTTDALGGTTSPGSKTGTITIADAATAHPDDPYEPNDDKASAYPLAFGADINAKALDEDWYSFSVQTEGNQDLWVMLAKAAYGSIELYDSTGMEVNSDRADSWGSGGIKLPARKLFTLNQYLYTGTTYYLRVRFNELSAMDYPVPAGAYSLGLGTPIPWTLASQFDIGEDQSSHSWMANGGSYYNVYYTNPGGYAWRLSGNGTSFIEMVMPVNSSATKYKILWQNSGWGHNVYGDLMVNGVAIKTYAGETIGGGSLNAVEIPNTYNTPNLTIRFADSTTFIDPNQIFTPAYLWIYEP